MKDRFPKRTRLFPIDPADDLAVETKPQIQNKFSGKGELPESPPPSIAKVMSNSVANSIPRDGRIPAGITYIGQMIAHDIVPRSNGVDSRNVTRQLNLDSVYGDKQYQTDPTIIDVKGKFILGKSFDCGCGRFRNSEDLLRDKDSNIALIPENRNDMNVLVSQLHLFWQRFHNKVVDHYFAANKALGSDVFLDAKDFVTCIFQRIVIDEFLYHVLDPVIYHLYCIKRRHFLYKKGAPFNVIPEEFSHAAFRFGHSMVRRKYRLQAGQPSVELKKLFIGKDQHGTNLSNNLVVDWLLFFGSRELGHDLQDASRIDLKIVDPMATIPGADLASGGAGNIIELNLAAGEKVGLPTARQIVTYIRKEEPELASEAEMKNHQDYPTPTYKGTILEGKEKDFPIDDLPLWPYILVEDSHPDDSGNRLGKLGSVIVAEVLMASIRSANGGQDHLGVRAKRNNQVGVGLNDFYRNTQRLRMLDLIEFVNSSD